MLFVVLVILYYFMDVGKSFALPSKWTYCNMANGLSPGVETVDSDDGYRTGSWNAVTHDSLPEGYSHLEGRGNHIYLMTYLLLNNLYMPSTF